MDKEEIKLYLKDNPNEIEKILEELGCHHIKTISEKRVQSALPDGDNPTSLQIKLNNSLSAVIYTRNEFDKRKYKDIFEIIQYLNDCTLPQSIQLVCNICGLRYSNKNVNKEESSISVLRRMVRNKKRKKNLEIVEENILSESFTERFIRCTCDLFLQDGINESTQAKFGVSFDTLDNRVVFPIRNYNGKLLSFKGRTIDKDWKIKGIPKYLSYYPISSEYYLYGYYENYYDLLMADEIYIGEAEKFVQQLDSMEINNCLAISKKVISPYQVKMLIKLGKPIVIMFDKDVTLEEILIECAKFKGLIDVYYVIDENNLLSGKESPTDRGSDIFNRLLENKKKYEWGGGIAI